MKDTPKSRAVPPALAALLLALAAAALYLPTLGADFAWDSQIQVRYSTFIHDLGNLPAVLSLRVLGMDVLDFNRPTQLLSLMADAALWGKHPLGYHLTSLALHVGVTVLLFTFCLRLLPLWCAFAAALVFAAHPVNCEAVAEVGNREDVLATLFVLAGLNCAAKWGATWRGAALGVPCFFLGIGAKECAVAGPAILALYWWWFRRDEPRRAWLLLIGAVSLTVGAFVLARFACETRDSAIFAMKPPRLGGSWSETLLIQTRIYAFYLRQIVWPHDLCADYGPYSIRNFRLPVALLTLVIVVAGQIWLGRRHRAFALGAAAFWLALLPVSNLIPLFQPAADRFLYLPLVGVALMGATLASRFRQGAVVLGLLALPLGWMTLQQQKVWHDDLSLWQDTTKKNPGSYSAFNNLGSALINAGKPNEALRALQYSVKVTKGAHPDTWAQIAVLLNEQGRTAEADDAYRKAVALDARLTQPDLLIRALMWEPPRVAKWQVILARNKTAAATPDKK